MSDITSNADRDGRTGRFLSGCKGGPGRQLGSRNKLAESFVADLRDCWELHGVEALSRVARDQPEVLVKVIASLLPRDVDLTVRTEIDVTTFADQFRAAVALLGNEPPKMRTIEHKAKSNGRHQR